MPLIDSELIAQTLSSASFVVHHTRWFWHTRARAHQSLSTVVHVKMIEWVWLDASHWSSNRTSNSDIAHLVWMLVRAHYRWKAPEQRIRFQRETISRNRSQLDGNITHTRFGIKHEMQRKKNFFFSAREIRKREREKSISKMALKNGVARILVVKLIQEIGNFLAEALIHIPSFVFKNSFIPNELNSCFFSSVVQMPVLLLFLHEIVAHNINLIRKKNRNER